MIVVDASPVVDFLLGPGGDAGDALADQLGRRGAVCAPYLIDAEVGEALRRYSLGLGLAPEAAVSLLQDFAELPIRRYPEMPLLPRAFEFRMSSTLHGGIYLALAEALECPLLTGDAALAGVSGCRAEVLLLSRDWLRDLVAK